MKVKSCLWPPGWGLNVSISHSLTQLSVLLYPHRSQPFFPFLSLKAAPVFQKHILNQAPFSQPPALGGGLRLNSLFLLHFKRCELCPHKDGALKRTDNGGE